MPQAWSADNCAPASPFIFLDPRNEPNTGFTLVKHDVR